MIPKSPASAMVKAPNVHSCNLNLSAMFASFPGLFSENNEIFVLLSYFPKDHRSFLNYVMAVSVVIYFLLSMTFLDIPMVLEDFHVPQALPYGKGSILLCKAEATSLQA
jgi:hypothetical protein